MQKATAKTAFIQRPNAFFRTQAKAAKLELLSPPIETNFAAFV